MFYWIKTSRFIKWIFRNQVWSIPNQDNKIYLTFDDGPTPEVTQWVLAELQRQKIKATFFCIGKNIEQNPEVFDKIIQEGHTIGNHTFNHLNGWKTTTLDYINDTKECEYQIRTNPLLKGSSQLFRPPYGKITKQQSKKLRKLGYKIIMWDVLTADFDASISPEKCFENATQKVRVGSIIVFHDSKKAFSNIQYVLPKAIAFYKNKGFIFDSIS